jgi:hypothetical protein
MKIKQVFINTLQVMLHRKLFIVIHPYEFFNSSNGRISITQTSPLQIPTK